MGTAKDGFVEDFIAHVLLEHVLKINIKKLVSIFTILYAFPINDWAFNICGVELD